MRYAEIKRNDIANGKGLCVSFWAQGCPHRCPDCHNKETWDFKGGKPYDEKVAEQVIEAIGANGIKRNLSILGGEPLAFVNLPMTYDIVCRAREIYPDIIIYMWTGDIYEEIKDIGSVCLILEQIDFLVDGRFEQDLKDVSLGYAGSSNQRIIDVQASLKTGEVKKLDSF